jgi:predicted  nucleic acid-binding Zn-ribbon protein
LYLKEFLETTQFRLQGLRKSVEELEKDEKKYRSNLEDAREALGKGYEMKFGEEGLGVWREESV